VDLGTGSLPGAGNVDVLLASYDSLGNAIWSRRLGGPGNDWLTGIAYDGRGGTVFVGYTDSISLPFDEGTLDSAGGLDIFVGRVDGFGGDDWAYLLGGTGDDAGLDVTVGPSGNVFLSGESNSPDLDFGPVPLVADEQGDMLLCSLALDGQVRWAELAGGSGHDYASAIAATDGGFVIAGASNSGSIDLGSGPMNADASGGHDVILGAFGDGGAPLWARRTSGHGESHAGDLAVAADGGVFLAGSSLGSSVDLGGGELADRGLGDAVLARFNERGDHLWSRRYGGGGDDATASVTLLPGGDAAFAGVSSSVTIDLGDGGLYSSGGVDMWLARVASETVHDVAAPELTVRLPAVLSEGPLRDRIAGQAIDDASGVEEVWLRFDPQVPLARSSTVPAALSCTPDRRSCTFTAESPITLPGAYYVWAWAMDRARNVGQPQFVGVTVLV
jgi:hypothetical protein